MFRGLFHLSISLLPLQSAPYPPSSPLRSLGFVFSFFKVDAQGRREELRRRISPWGDIAWALQSSAMGGSWVASPFGGGLFLNRVGQIR